MKEQFYEIDVTGYETKILKMLYSIIKFANKEEPNGFGWGKTIHNLEMVTETIWDEYEDDYITKILIRGWAIPKDWSKFYEKVFSNLEWI